MYIQYQGYFYNILNRIGGVMVSMLASSGFEPRSGETKDYEISICCFSAACSIKGKEQRLVESESGVGRHVYTQTCVIELAL